ncbi:unnamed protein product [Medioppia subpectinata]|uniref:UDENN domain-containing protein n=1 Tax=Medioppia subpectinata TaxID=1979941 RepID=A0A7R9KWG1_9ACAR|nr:unnamed protein product [Medioppia subpectinata]CAG2109975.1 unnamed protein product [Medioppia subpectinata]
MTSTKAVQQLQSIHVFENQLQNSLSMKWTFPSIGHTLRSYVEKQLNDDHLSDTHSGVGTEHRFHYHHFDNVWIYRHSSEAPLQTGPAVSPAKQFSIVIAAKDFNPEKYEMLTKIFVKIYVKTGEIQRLLAYYLTLLIHGSFTVSEDQMNNCKRFNLDDYESVAPAVVHNRSPIGIKSVIKMFGLDVILIYTALILKRRVVVYHHKLDTLLQFVRVLPAFVWHRWPDCYQILYPCVELQSPAEIGDLTARRHYIAGFLDTDVESRTDLYDIYVNLAAIEITVSHGSRDAFAMTKTHKEIAVFMTRQADRETNTNWDLIQDICDKNRELIETLKRMATASAKSSPAREGSVGEEEVLSPETTVGPTLTLEALKERKLNPNLENFLWNLAVAENLCI